MRANLCGRSCCHLCILKCRTACRWHPQLSSVCIVTAASGLICSKGSTMIALRVIQMVLFVTFGSIWIHLAIWLIDFSRWIQHFQNLRLFCIFGCHSHSFKHVFCSDSAVTCPRKNAKSRQYLSVLL